MSLWGATVITNLVSAVLVGESIVQWLWGGYAVDDPTIAQIPCTALVTCICNPRYCYTARYCTTHCWIK